MITIETKGLTELIRRMSQFPDKLNAGMKEAMDDTLLVMTESIPPYPNPPENSDYRRTGTLGRTLGSSIQGGQSGQAEIYEVRGMGSEIEGHFGTNLNYAPLVIGDGTQTDTHRKRWWTLRGVAEKAQDKINRIWEALAEAMAKFLEGQ